MGNKPLNLWVIGAIILVALYVAVPGFQDGVKDLFQPDIEMEAIAGACLQFDGTTMTLGPMSYKYSPGTSAATESARVYKKVNGDYLDLGSKNKTQTFETQPGEEFKIIYADSSSVFYAAEANIIVPCAAAFETAEVDGGKYKLVANKTPSITVFNDDDGLKNTATNNESMAANDVANLDVKIVYASKGGWSAHGDAYMTIKVNSTEITEVTLSSSDVSVSSADVPSFRSANNASAGFKMYAFKHAGIDTESTQTVRYTLTLESSTADPAKSPVELFLDDEDYYQNSDSGLPEYGAEDEDDSDVGHTTEVKSAIIID